MHPQGSPPSLPAKVLLHRLTSFLLLLGRPGYQPRQAQHSPVSRTSTMRPVLLVRAPVPPLPPIQPYSQLLLHAGAMTHFDLPPPQPHRRRPRLLSCPWRRQRPLRQIPPPGIVVSVRARLPHRQPPPPTPIEDMPTTAGALSPPYGACRRLPPHGRSPAPPPLPAANNDVEVRPRGSPRAARLPGRFLSARPTLPVLPPRWFCGLVRAAVATPSAIGRGVAARRTVAGRRRAEMRAHQRQVPSWRRMASHARRNSLVGGMARQ